MPSLSRALSLSAAAIALLAMAGAAEARNRTADYRDSSYRCDTGGDQVLGALTGAVLGGVVGGQFGNDGDDRAIGAVTGALLGGAAGASIADGGCDAGYARGYDDEAAYYGDDAYYDDSARFDPLADDSAAYDEAFGATDPYQDVTWRDDESGAVTTLEPGDWYQDGDGNDCREFSQLIVIDGRREEATGTACRQDDGTWRIVE
jgi:surface antigen